MTISSAMQTALSGLRAAARTTDVISMNIANSTTPGFARRQLELVAQDAQFGGGVSIGGVVRLTPPGVLAARRDAQADVAYASIANQFLTGLETSVGTPDNPRAISNLVADFDTSLLEAASRPDATERLQVVLAAAHRLVAAFNETSEDISNARGSADTAIGAQVVRLNGALEEVEYLNREIARANVTGLDASALVDMRQIVIDEVHEMVPVRESIRDNGQVALYSLEGVVLLDGPASQFEFTTANQVTPYMTLDGGQLSGLVLNGRTIRMDSAGGSLPGGSLAAQFAVRDELGEDAQAQLDAAARNLIERFQNPAVDPTLSATDAGLFTDGGLAFDAANEVGLAERLGVNAAVDPEQGGEEWRIRDGINAAAPGAVGQSAIIDNLRAALSERLVTGSGDFGTGALTMTDLATGMLGRIGVQRVSAEQSLAFSSAALFETSQAELAAGVDTDTELQHLLVVEKAYAANVRMIETVDEMMETLLRL